MLDYVGIICGIIIGWCAVSTALENRRLKARLVEGSLRELNLHQQISKWKEIGEGLTTHRLFESRELLTTMSQAVASALEQRGEHDLKCPMLITPKAPCRCGGIQKHTIETSGKLRVALEAARQLGVKA